MTLCDMPEFFTFLSVRLWLELTLAGFTSVRPSFLAFEHSFTCHCEIISSWSPSFDEGQGQGQGQVSRRGLEVKIRVGLLFEASSIHPSIYQIRSANKLCTYLRDAVRATQARFWDRTVCFSFQSF